MSDQSGDQTEAELERTRKVVAAAMAEQITTNEAAVAEVSSEAATPEEAATSEAPKAPKGNASRKDN